jgi:hypothetical protein
MYSQKYARKIEHFSSVRVFIKAVGTGSAHCLALSTEGLVLPAAAPTAARYPNPLCYGSPHQRARAHVDCMLSGRRMLSVACARARGAVRVGSHACVAAGASQRQAPAGVRGALCSARVSAL